MSRWDIEREDHVFENTTWHPGPILRSRVVDSEVVDQDPAGEPVDGDVVCPTCHRRLPGVATACPDDGTPLA